MSVDAQAMDRLARKLLAAGPDPRLDPTELDAVLSWLGGGQRNGAGRLSMALGRPETRPDRVEQLYRLLDRRLLGDGQLDLAAAHLSGDRPDGEKKARFRRLIQAFHPDRYPELEAWLTPRSQILHTAYGAFKRGSVKAGSVSRPRSGPAGRPGKAEPAPEPDHPWQPGPYRHSARVVPEHINLIKRLGHRALRSQRLAALLIVGMIMIAVLPLLALHLVVGRDDAPDPSATRAAVTAPAPERRAAPVAVAPAPSASAPETLTEAQIEAFLQRFSSYVIGGDLDGLLGLVERETPADQDGELDWMAAHFAEIFTLSRSRHQEFRILSIEQQQPYWSVHALSRLTMAFDDLTARHDETPYRLTLRRRADGELRIVGIDG